MAIDSTWGSTHLKRNEIFNQQLKEMFEDTMIAPQFVRMFTDIPSDSIRTSLMINSIGTLEVDDWFEGVALPERRMDTGRFTFNIDEFKGIKVGFTDHFFETSFQANEVLSKTPVEQKRAFDVYFETKIMELANAQTNNNANSIFGAAHRVVGSGNGTSAPTNALVLEDFAYAHYALKKAKAPMTGLVAIVTPETAFHLDTLSNIVNVSNNAMWEGIITTGMLDNTGLKFIRNIYGFDVYVSNFVANTTADEAALTTFNGTAVGTTAGMAANMFFTMADDSAKPFVGAFGRTPVIKSWRDDDIETEYHALTASFGLGLFRPESLVTVLSSQALTV